LPAFQRRWCDSLVSRCQQLAGHVIDGRGPALSRYLLELIADMPADLAIHERLVGRMLLGRVLAQMARRTGIDGHPDVTRAFIDWAGSEFESNEWDADVRRFVGCCAAALDTDQTRPAHDRVDDVRIVRALRAIETRYADPRLTLRSVATASGMSIGHVARMLKRRTGFGFSALVHRERIAAARRLLSDTTLTVKEIAGDVGYGSSSQLGRHFRRLYGHTPTVFRRAQQNSTIN
jgi:AraC-like DNA-binding protein